MHHYWPNPYLNSTTALLDIIYYQVLDCPPGMEYKMCGWNISCDDIGTVRDCRNSPCESGCFCSNGYVLEDGVCVDSDTCPSK